MNQSSLQDHYAPDTRCFGSGPANEQGLRIKSRVEGEEVVLDWAAAYHLTRQAGADSPPFTVTADCAVTLRKPTPSTSPLHVRARVVELSETRAVVDATLAADGVGRATC